MTDRRRPSVAFSQDVPAVDVAAIRADTLAALEAFDEEAWYRDPLVTVIDGVAQEGGEEVDTTDAFGQVNGRQVQASAAVVDATIDHVLRYRSPATDLREQVRAAEARMLSVHAASLIANQAKDFMKQVRCSGPAAPAPRPRADAAVAHPQRGPPHAYSRSCRPPPVPCLDPPRPKQCRHAVDAAVWECV